MKRTISFLNSTKKNVLALLITFFTIATYGQRYTGDLIINNQADIDAFNYSEVTGNLTISESVNNDITNFNGFSELITVGGFLLIHSNQSLTSLSGLESLTTIGGFLDISTHDSLLSLSGLESLTEIGGLLWINSNTSLLNFCAISSLIGDANPIIMSEYTVINNGYNPSYTEIQTTTQCSVNPPTVSQSLLDVSIMSGTSFSPITLSNTFTDPDGDILTYTATSSDASVVTVGILNGILTLTEASVGISEISVTATDVGSLSVISTFSVTITPENNPPTVSQSLLDVSIMSGTSFSPITLSNTFTDSDGDILTYTATSSDASVVTVGILNGILTLTEASVGISEISVTATDVGSLSVISTFSVTITPENNPPMVSQSLLDVSIMSGTSFSPITLSHTFTDSDGDILTYTATSSDASVVTVGILNGILTLTEASVGISEISVTATDVGSLSVISTFSVTITPENNPPTVSQSLLDVSIMSGTSFSPITLSNTFTDSDGDILTYTATSSDASVVTVGILNGILTLTEASVGISEISVTATDVGSLSVISTFSVTITPENNPPMVSQSLLDVSIMSSTSFSPITLSNTFTDSDGDILTYTATSSDASVVTVGILNGILTLTEASVGISEISVTATDVGSLSVISTFSVTITPENNPPTVSQSLLDVSIMSGTSFSPITLSNTFTDSDGDILTYTATSSDASVVTVGILNGILTLTEASVGISEISVTATDVGSLSVISTFSVTITPENNPPTVSQSLLDVSIMSGTSFSPITLSHTFTDSDGDILTYTATSSDASVVTVGILNGILTLTEASVGISEISVTATDVGSLSVISTFSVTITPENNPPTVSQSLLDVLIMSGTSFSPITLSHTFTDSDGDILTYTATSSDASVVTVGILNGILTLTEASVGISEISVTATDVGSLSVISTFSVTITPENNPPTVSQSLLDVSIMSGTSFSPITLSHTFTDSDGDILTYTATSSDASVVTVGILNGILTLTEASVGISEISVTATDVGSLSVISTFSVTITPENNPPTVSQSLLDVSIMSGTSFSPITLSHTFTDSDGDILTYTATSSDASVVTVGILNGILTLTEASVGISEISVTATDVGSLSVISTFSVTITPENNPPTVSQSLLDVSIMSGTSFSPITLSHTFTDSDGDILTYTATSSDASVVTVGILNGILTLTEASVGISEISVTATDVGGLSVISTFSVTITPENNPPTVSQSLLDVSIMSGTSFSPITLSHTFTDSDGDILTYTATSSDASVVTVGILNGILTLTEASVGISEISVTATDVGGLSVISTFSVTITPENNPPTVSQSLLDVSIMSGTSFSPITLSHTFTDSDGDILTYTATSSDASVVTVGILNGILTLTEASVGISEISITATDVGGLSVISTFSVTITPENNPPTVSQSLLDVSIMSGTSFSPITLSHTFTDSDGDILTYTATSSDASVVTVGILNGILTLTEASVGISEISVTATDVGSLSVISTFSVTISNNNREIFDGDLTLDDQDAIDAFNYRLVTGNLTIEETVAGNITNLSNLISLTQVGGRLNIRNNSSLTSLSGLDFLTQIGEDLRISSNSSLLNFCALSSLVGDDSQITSEEYIVSNNEYNPFYNVIQDENICSNEDGDILLGDLTLDNQDAINVFNYRLVTGNLTIEETTSDNITNLDGLSRLITLGGNLSIQNNTSLTNFCGVSSLVGDENQIKSREYSVSDNSYNPTYAFIQDEYLCSFATGIFDGDVTLNSQNDIDAFNYTAITGDLTIEETTTGNITDFSNLNSLIQVGGNLAILSNETLLSLRGLDSLTQVVGSLSITFNTALTDFCTISSLVSNSITNDNYSVTGNNYNPSYEFIQQTNTCGNEDGEIFIGDLTLTSQDSINTINYRAITGSLIIEEITANNIMNLDSLTRLTSIGGNLVIQNNTTLLNFCGVSSLVSDNNEIDSIDYHVSGNGYNPSYRFIQETDLCSNADGGILVVDSLMLTSQVAIDTFNYRAITGSLIISTNITNLDGLSGLTIVGSDLQISLNSSLTSLSGLDSLTIIGGDLLIDANSSLPSLSGLESLTTVNGNLLIQNNIILTSLMGLIMIDSIKGNLSITNNSDLVDFCVVSSLVSYDNEISTDKYEVDGNGYNPPYSFIQEATLCTNSDGGIFEGDLMLTNQETIDALNYRAVTGSVIVQENVVNNIINLNGLNELTSIGGTLSIQNNSALTSLSSLDSLNLVDSTLNIKNNVSLFNFCAISSLVGDPNNITIGEYTVTGNGYNPPYKFIQEATLCNNADGGIFNGNLILDSQNSLDTFSYRGVTGFLLIRESSATPITNLDSLNVLTTVGGDMRIERNNSLPSLSGLDSLNYIGGKLQIGGNSILTDFCAVSSLVGDTNSISSREYRRSNNKYNPAYEYIQESNYCSNLNGAIYDGNVELVTQTQIDNFNFTRIAGNLLIRKPRRENNDPIMNLDSLNKLIEIGGSLNIQLNDSLTSLNGLSALTQIGNLFIINNISLTSLKGLEMLDSIRGYLSISSNSTLIDFCPISSLIGDDNVIDSRGYIGVDGNGYDPLYRYIQNSALCSNTDGRIFDGDLILTNQDTVDAFNYKLVTGNITIEESITGDITNLDSLKHLIIIDGNLIIQNNDSLTSLRGLESLTNVGNYLNIQNNFSLTSLRGLESLTNVGNYLSIQNNFSLMSISSLESLTNIAGYLSIQNNFSLMALNGLESVTFIGGYLLIIENVSLVDFCAVSSLVGDGNVIEIIKETKRIRALNEYEVRGNAYNPSYMFIQDPTLCTNSDGGILEGDLMLGSQAMMDTIKYRAVTGNLTTGSEIMSLDDLDGLIAVGGNLDIQNNSFLTSLRGLDSLIMVGGSILIQGNDTLITLSGLEALSFIENGEIFITNNSSLVDFCAIAPLVGDDNIIDSEEYIVSANGYNPTYALIQKEAFCSNADGGIYIGELTLNNQDSIDVFSYRAITGNLLIQEAIAGNITSLDSLNHFTAVGNHLRITNNDFLTSLSGLEMLNSIGGNLEITNNPSLIDFCTISSLAKQESDLTTEKYIVGTNFYNPSYEELQQDNFCSPNDPVVVGLLSDVRIVSGLGFKLIDISSIFRDSDGDELSYTAISSNEEIVTVVVNGTSLTLSQISVGTVRITVTATDATLLSVTTEFMVTIATNNAPVRTNRHFPVFPDLPIDFLSVAIDLTPFFRDSDKNAGDTLTFSVSSSNDEIVTTEIVNESSYIFSTEESGKAKITITATDIGGLTVSESLMVIVEEAPIILGISTNAILAIYPNPSSGVFQLSSTADMVQIYDMSGRLVYQGSNVGQIDLTSNPTGQYLLEVRLGKEKRRRTVIKK